MTKKRPGLWANIQALKKIPEGNKGLPKLPKAVRNKMGYMNTGGIVKKAKHRGCGKVNPSRRKVTKYS